MLNTNLCFENLYMDINEAVTHYKTFSYCILFPSLSLVIYTKILVLKPDNYKIHNITHHYKDLL